ncbi:MAG: hypothetical protein JO027_14660 [Solirubrobacterales bacterium]|nr:hypothetical protein [Solirubrobacterales bacterium]
MSDRVMERVRHANPFPGELPAPPIEEVWRRLDAEPEPQPGPGARLRLVPAWLPSMGAVMTAMSVLMIVGIAVLAIVLLGHKRSTTALQPTSPAMGSTAVADCIAHGRLTRGYSAMELRSALATMPANVKKYTNCGGVIQHALLAEISGRRLSISPVGAAQAITLFRESNSAYSGPGVPSQTVIPSTVRVFDTFQVPGVGPVQYWVGETAQHGVCQAFRLPDGMWANYPMTSASPDNGRSAGTVPGCSATRAQVVAGQGNAGTGLAPTSVDEQSISLEGSDGRWSDIYYGTVSANGATAVKDPTTGETAALIKGRYFVLVIRRHGNCAGCDNLQAIGADGHNLAANYGP